MFNDSTDAAFIFYILAMLFVGWRGYRATNDLSDYILGGRKLSSLVTALSAGASDMSGWLLMGLPGAVFLAGISGAWIAIGLIVGAWFNWRFVASRLRLYTERMGNALTLPDYLSKRFYDRHHVLRITSTVTILIFFTIYCASGVVAGARLFESLFGLSYGVALWVGALTTIAYVFMGGFLAISWTDTIQASLIVIALVLVPLAVIYDSGGVTTSIDMIKKIDITHVSLMGHLNTIGVISLLGWGLGYCGQPHILARFMASRSIKKIKKSRRIAITWMTLCLMGAVAVGFFGSGYYAMHPDQAVLVNANPEKVFMEIVKQLFHPALAGVLLAAILAAIMSALSCQLLVCSSALTSDIYKTFLRKKAPERELVWCGRLMVLLIAVIAIFLARDPNSYVLTMVSYAWAGFGAAFGPVIVLSLLWSRMTRAGALAGMVTGALTVLVWKQYAWFQLYEIVPGFIFATIAIVLGSFASRKPAKSVKEAFDEVHQEFKYL